MKSSLNDYAEIAINFGFIALFVTALPIAAFAGFISSLLEVKADAWKLMLIYQRPIPRGAEDIGMWLVIYSFKLINIFFINYFSCMYLCIYYIGNKFSLLLPLLHVLQMLLFQFLLWMYWIIIVLGLECGFLFFSNGFVFQFR